MDDGRIESRRGVPPLTSHQDVLWLGGDLTEFVRLRLAQLEPVLAPYCKLGISPSGPLVEEMMRLYQVTLHPSMDAKAAFHTRLKLFPTPELRRAAELLDRKDRGYLYSTLQELESPTSGLFSDSKQELFRRMAKGRLTAKDVCLYGAEMSEEQLRTYLRIAMTDPQERARWLLFSHTQPVTTNLLHDFLSTPRTLSELIAPHLKGETPEEVTESVRTILVAVRADEDAWRAITSQVAFPQEHSFSRLKRGFALNAIHRLSPPERHATGVTPAQFVGADIEEVGHRPITNSVEMADALIAISSQQLEQRLAASGPQANKVTELLTFIGIQWDPVSQHEQRRQQIQAQIAGARWTAPQTDAPADKVSEKRRHTIEEFIDTERNYANAIAVLSESEEYQKPLDELKPFQRMIEAAGRHTKPEARQAALIDAFKTPEYARYMAAHATLITLGRDAPPALEVFAGQPFQRTMRLETLANDLMDRTPDESPLKEGAIAMHRTAHEMAQLINATTIQG
jgi:hypothetical protein